VGDSLPDIDGEMSYRVEIDTAGVLVTLRLRVGRLVTSMPCEFAVGMLPPEVFAGGSYAPVSLLGARGWQPLPKELPVETGPGTHLLGSDLFGVKLRGKGIEVSAECLAGPQPYLYDMRSRDYRPEERVYWLLYQWNLSQGEMLIRTRLSARKIALAERPQKKGRIWMVEGKQRIEVRAIVVSSGAHRVEKAAARMLQQYLGETGSREVPVLQSGDPALPGRGIIFVGQDSLAIQRKLYARPELEELGPDGFIIRARGGNLLVAGGGYRGTVYAVYRFLEQMGCRFYSEELEIVPQKSEVVLPAPFDMSDRPAFEWRAMWGTIDPMKEGLSPGEWEARVGEEALPKMMAIPKGGFWHHTMGFLLPAREWFPKHPEYFAMIGGERKAVEPAVQQYCLSNPELLRVMTDRVLRWIEEDPDPLYYPVHYGDVGNFCECDACKAMYQEKGSITDAVIWFLNQIAQEVAKKHPEKFLTILAYWGTRRPPVRERPARNLLIVFCAISECQARPWSAPVNRKLRVTEDLEKWIALHPLGPKGIITFEYPCTYHYVGYPYPALYAFAENLRYYQRLGLRGVYICGLTKGHLVHLYSYVMSRLMWNPQQSLDRLIQEFTDAWYGRAAKPMRAYVDALHRAAFESQSEGVMDCHAGPGQRFFREMLTPEFLETLSRHFADAEAAADSDLIRRRIGYDKWGLLFVDLFLHGRAGSDLLPTATPEGYRVQASSESDYRKMAELLRLTQLFNRPWEVAPHAQFSLSAIIGFEPTASPWWTCPEVKALMEDPAGAFRKNTPQREAAARHLVALENEHLKVLLVPSLGGRIWRIFAKGLDADLLWRGTLPWHLLQKGANPSRYLSFGGYEEYTGEKWGAPGWAERYRCQVSEDRQSATLSATLPSGLTLQRTVRLLPDRPGLEITTEILNPTSETIRGVALRAHPQFAYQAGKPGLMLAVKGQEAWSQQPMQSETWLQEANLPGGAWGVVDAASGVSLIDEFDPSQIRACYLYVSPGREWYNLELFSPTQDLAPGAKLEMKHRYVIMKQQYSVQ